MRPLFAALFALLLALPAAGPALADDAADARSEVRQVIESQLDAFRRDDGAAAFAYASPGIQARFHDPQTFMRMVREGYAMVYRPQEVEFRRFRADGAEAVQEILFVGPDGQVSLALYRLERQPDGRWRINSVAIRTADEATS